MSKTSLNDTIETAVTDCGLVLHGVSHTKDGITIYIKKPDDAVGIKDCEKVIEQLGYLTNIDDLHIEVESSGYAPLFKPEHYQSHINKKIKVVTREKSIQGTLQKIDADGIVLLNNDTELTFSWAQIVKSTPITPGVKS